MKSVVTAKGSFEAAMNTGAVHQPWMGALVPMTSSPEGLLGEFHRPAAAAHFAQPRRGERLWDGVFALVFVAACATAGWAGAVWL